MKKKIIILLLMTGALLLLFSYVSNAQDRNKATSQSITKPDIIWITCEDMSPHLGCYGEQTIKTPNLDALAKDGVKFTNVYTVSGVCAPSRCGIITGMYPQSIGGDNMRNYQPGARLQDEVNGAALPSYSIVPPAFVKCFPEYLRLENYYCTNNPKEDYQFEAPVTVWDESSSRAHWKNRPEGKPFFAVFNLGVTHESQIWRRDTLRLLVDPATVQVPPYYPDLPQVRHDIARHLSNIIEMDRQAGKLIRELKDAGLYDNCVLFFFSDHGDGLPYVKREISRRGLHIPLIVKLPGGEHAGETDTRLISAIDMGPSVLSLAGVPVPEYMHGRAFLGKSQQPERRYIFGARDRMDSEVDRVRSVFDGRYQYIRNCIPGKTRYQDIIYRRQMPMMRAILDMRDSGTLSEQQMQWFQVKPEEELYDTEKDPDQLNDLASDVSYRDKLVSFRNTYDIWISEVGDLHVLPEKELQQNMWSGTGKAPLTAQPVLEESNGHYSITCATPGASIAFTIRRVGSEGSIPWQIYRNGPLQLSPGEMIAIRAQRIGYSASVIERIIE